MNNHEQLIIDASEVLGEFAKSHSKSCDLFFSNNVFSCREKCHAASMSYFIRHFTASEMSIGLTGPQWLRLGRKAAKRQEVNTE